MALGIYKHCGVTGVARNAIVCPRCGGEDPCPYVSSTRRIVGLGVGVPLLIVAILILATAGTQGAALVCLTGLPAVALIRWGLGAGRSIIR